MKNKINKHQLYILTTNKNTICPYSPDVFCLGSKIKENVSGGTATHAG